MRLVEVLEDDGDVHVDNDHEVDDDEGHKVDDGDEGEPAVPVRQTLHQDIELKGQCHYA